MPSFCLGLLSVHQECSIWCASANNSALEKFDDHLRSNSALSDAQWLQASMPIKHCLGIRRVTSLAAPAFLASVASTLVLQEQILAQFPCPTDSFLDSYLSSWSTSAVAKFLNDSHLFIPLKFPANTESFTANCLLPRYSVESCIDNCSSKLELLGKESSNHILYTVFFPSTKLRVPHL